MPKPCAPFRRSTTSAFLLGFVLATPLSCRPAAPAPVSKPACPTLAEIKPPPAPVAPEQPVKAPLCGMPEDLKRPDWPTTLSSTVETELEPAEEGSVSIALLPDTQYYASCRYPHLENQGKWLVQERARRHLLGAITLGDLTDHNSADEWRFVRESLALVPPDFPLMLSTGNHDTGSNGSCDSRETLLSEYFSESWAKESSALRTTMTEGKIENAFYSLNSGSFRLGVLMLEWSPRRATVEWANQVLNRFKDHRVIVATHAYLYDDGTRYDYAVRRQGQHWNPLEYRTANDALAEDGSHDGEMLWNALIRRHPGIFLVVSGHVLGKGTAQLTSQGDAGNLVHQILVNYQMLDEGGLGYLRLVEFLPDGKTLHLKTYSPSLGFYSYAAGQDFRLQVAPPLFAGTSTVVASGERLRH